MLFNSINFAIFLPIVFFCYWFIFNKNVSVQNSLLLGASYFFYGCWDWRFVSLLLFSTVLDYYSGIKIYEASTKRIKKNWLWLSICVNVGLLAFFKYYNFFIESFVDFLLLFGINSNPWLLNIILPVGISFYTFHGLSYIIDIYKERIKPEKNLIIYGVFVSFFPLLIAGPIERATHLLPQIKKKRVFDYANATEGLKQMLWGFFKKMVIADNCGFIVDSIFSNYNSLSGSTLFLGGMLFHIQVYCDFSGFSDIAVGVARLFGIELMQNFRFPLFANSLVDIWRRWHISLSSWLKDYLYIPLGGGRGTLLSKIRNIFIVFAVSGFWHGAKWTFIIWGLINAFFLVIELIIKQTLYPNDSNKTIENTLIPSFKLLIQMGVTFLAVAMTRFFYRSDTLTQALSMYKTIFSKSFFSLPSITNTRGSVLVMLMFFFFLIEWLGKDNKYAIATIFKNNSQTLRWLFYSFIISMITLYGIGDGIRFIYFNF